MLLYEVRHSYFWTASTNQTQPRGRCFFVNKKTFREEDLFVKSFKNLRKR